MDIWTVGHSTLDADVFGRMLQAHGIQLLVDIRSHPGSRRYPQYNQERMRVWLPSEYQVSYAHIPELGGRRNKSKTVDENIVSGWTHPSFRNYAAYTLEDNGAYEHGIERLLKMASRYRVCYMCSESCVWRCHRSLVSTTLTVRGHRVLHIINDSKVEQHMLGKYGAEPCIHDGIVTYPGAQIKLEV